MIGGPKIPLLNPFQMQPKTTTAWIKKKHDNSGQPEFTVHGRNEPVILPELKPETNQRGPLQFSIRVFNSLPRVHIQKKKKLAKS